MRVLVKSFGCPTNLADGNALASCLIESGYSLVDSVSRADVIVYNTCGVKGPTENRMIALAQRIPADKKLIIAGCLPLINRPRLEKEVHFNALTGPALGKKIVSVVRRVLNGEAVVAVEENQNEKPELTLPRTGSGRIISIVPICYGCLGSCTYCCVVHARGRLRSYSVQEVVSRVAHDVDEGFREIWLTAQDTASYGRDIETRLPTLLSSVCQVDGDFRIRVGMMNPNWALDIIDDLVFAFEDEKIFKFLHLPVQSGDGRVLERMKRFYTVSDFKRILRRFRSHFPTITVSTDVICGFPGETREAFKNTMSLIEETKPDIVNLSKFFARPRTAAMEMKNMFVAQQEVKRRTSEMAESIRRVGLERNKVWIGWTGKVLVDEVGKVPGSWIGRNYAYKPVAIKSAESLLGRTLTVQVSGANPTFLEGRIVG